MGRMFWGPVSGLGMIWAVITLLLDQASKLLILMQFFPSVGGCQPFDPTMVRHCKYEVTSNFDLVMVWNRGISYGLFQQTSVEGRVILLGLTFLAIVLLVAWLAQNYARIAAVSLGLILGGAIGNAIDRMAYGAVADFFSLHAYGYNWYVFNIADMAIVAGVFGLLYDAVVSGPRPKNVSNGS